MDEGGAGGCVDVFELPVVWVLRFGGLDTGSSYSAKISSSSSSPSSSSTPGPAPASVSSSSSSSPIRSRSCKRSVNRLMRARWAESDVWAAVLRDWILMPAECCSRRRRRVRAYSRFCDTSESDLISLEKVETASMCAV